MGEHTDLFARCRAQVGLIPGKYYAGSCKSSLEKPSPPTSVRDCQETIDTSQVGISFSSLVSGGTFMPPSPALPALGLRAAEGTRVMGNGGSRRHSCREWEGDSLPPARLVI